MTEPDLIRLRAGRAPGMQREFDFWKSFIKEVRVTKEDMVELKAFLNARKKAIRRFYMEE